MHFTHPMLGRGDASRVQSDLCRLRLTTARSYVKLLTDGQMGDTPVVGGTNLRIGAAVQGLGPFFKLKLDIQNGGAAPLTNLPVTVTCVFSSLRSFFVSIFCSRAVFLRLLRLLNSLLTLSNQILQLMGRAGSTRRSTKCHRTRAKSCCRCCCRAC